MISEKSSILFLIIQQLANKISVNISVNKISISVNLPDLVLHWSQSQIVEYGPRCDKTEFVPVFPSQKPEQSLCIE